MKRGFTTIELLVVISILSLLSAILIAYSRTGERQIILFREGAKVKEIISRAKFLSLAIYGESEVPCGYGVHFETSGSFIIFKDLAVNCASSDRRYSGSVEAYESFKLDPAILFDSLTLSDVVFIPPNPTVVITPVKDEAVVILKTIDGEGSIKITITSAGQISTE